MFIIFIVTVIAIALTVYLGVMYLVKCLLDFYKYTIDWKILRYLLTFFTIVIVVIFHILFIGIVIAII